MPRWFARLLRLLPANFRRQHAEEMWDLLAGYIAGRSVWLKAALLARASLDVLWLAVLLRFPARRPGRAGRYSMNVLWQDLVFTGRALALRPAFTLVALATLALGIGGNAAVFSVVNGVLLRPLPYVDAERIGVLWHEFGNGAQNMPAVNPLDVRDYRDRSRVFETFTIATGREWILGDEDDPELVDVGIVEAGFFEFFGTAPVHGASFTPGQDLPGAAPVAILSHRLWARRFGSDPGVVGQRIELDGTRMDVVGVLPASFRLFLPAEAFLLRDAEIWVPMRLDPAAVPARNVTLYSGFGRLRADATFAQAQGEIEALAAELRREHAELDSANLRARIVPLLHDVVKEAEPQLILLLSAVGFVLLIACANVANLAVVRGHGRAHEYALRAAIGAGRSDLVRLVMVETAVLSLAGALVGILIAYGGIEVLKALAPASLPRLATVTIDTTVLLFAAAVTAASAVLFGLAPALRTTARDPAEVLGAESRSTGGRSQRRFREALVVAEVAASLALLVGAGLTLRSFTALTVVRPGFATEGALTFRVSLPTLAFPDAASRIALVDDLIERLSALPTVDGVTAASLLPLTGAQSQQPVAYDEQTATNWESVTADRRLVTPGFFEVVGAELVSGRWFARGDLDAGNLIIVDDQLAELAFPGSNAVGRNLQVKPNGTPEEQRYAQIIGVVSHLRHHDLGRSRAPQIYWPMAGLTRFSVWVRSTADPEALVADIRSHMAALAPGAPVEDIRTIEDLVDGALAPARLTLALMSLFGIIALLLASIGTYGVLSYAIAERTREIGIRLALGQAPEAIMRSVMARGGVLVALAVVIGLGAAATLSRLAAGLLYGIEPLDPLTYGVTTIVLVLAAGTACWLPARRATRVDPLIALRSG